MKKLEDYVLTIPDFPEKGIMFRDVTSVLQDADGLHLAIDTMQDLVKDLETPTLEEYGVDRKEFFDVIEKMAHDAMESGSPQNTRRPITEEEVEQLYRNLWD